MQLPPKATGDQIALLQAIAQGQAANNAEISLVLNSLNRHVAQLSQKNGKIITGIQETVLKKINQELVDNDNVIDQVSTAILARTQEWLNDNQLLLQDLSAAAGLRQPGDPLEAALIEQVSVAPDIAYSATLLLASGMRCRTWAASWRCCARYGTGCRVNRSNSRARRSRSMSRTQSRLPTLRPCLPTIRCRPEDGR